MYQGRVMRKDGTPLEGIRVSDGRNTCLSKSDGSFFLEGWEKASLIFCNVLTDSHDDWYLPIKETCESYDFRLSPVEDEEAYSFLHLSDTEIGSRGCGSFLPWLKETASKQSAKFLLHGGDIAGERAMVAHREEMNFQTLGIPVRYVIGNHDFLPGAYGEERYEQLYGPIWYSFDIGSIRFVVLAISQGSGGFSSGYTFEEQCRWLKKDLEHGYDGKSMVVLRHNAFPECTDFVANFETDSFDFLKNGLRAWIQGHAHTCFTREIHSVLHMCSSRPDSGGIDNTPGSVRKVSVRGSEITTEVLYNTLPEHAPTDALWLTRLPGEIQYTKLIPDGKDLLIATSDDGYPKKCGVYRLSEKDGAVLWYYPTKNSVKGEIALDGDRVYAQDCQGFLYCLDAKSGALIWENDGAAPEHSQSTHIRSSLRIHDEILYAGTGMHPVFFNKENGEFLAAGASAKKGSGAPAKTVLSEDGKTVVYNAQWMRLVALDAKTAETKWELKSQKEILENHGAFWYRTASPLVYRDRIYAFGFFHGAYANIETGEVLLHKKINLCTEVCGAAVIDGDTLYLPTGKQGVVVLDKDSLEEKWRYPVSGARLFSASYVYGSEMTVEASPAIVGNALMIAANDGYVYFYDKTKPQLLSKTTLVFPTLTTPLIKDEVLFAASFNGVVGKYKRQSK